MNKENFYIELEKLNQDYYARRKAHQDSEEILFSIEELLINQLHTEPTNSELWLRLVMLEYTPPWERFERMISYLEKIFEYDPYNIDAHIVRCYYSYMLTPDMEKKYFDDLVRLKPDDAERAAFVEMVKAFYYSQEKNMPMKEESLLLAINYCPHFAHPYITLGEFYLRRKRLKEGKAMLESGLRNIVYVYSAESRYDITDIEEFYNEAFRGHMSPLRLDMALDLAKRVGVDISA